jgi:hypothetical protein
LPLFQAFGNDPTKESLIGPAVKQLDFISKKPQSSLLEQKLLNMGAGKVPLLQNARLRPWYSACHAITLVDAP